MKLDRICIIGGGSAGWMTASMLSRHFEGTGIEITVVEADDIPRIGIGESTTQFFNTFIRYLGLKDEDWMPKCNATYKHSVKFTNFNQNGSFHYPFGPRGTDIPLTEYHNWRRGRNIDSMTFCRVFSDVIDPIEGNRLYPPFLDRYVGYHVDALLFGDFLRDHYAIPKGVTHIKGKVADIQSCVDGISRVYLCGGDRYVDGDFFIDCTGFRGLLMNHLNVKWVDWSDLLKNNSTWAVRKPYTNKKEQLQPYTECTGLSSGWVWNVPTWDRIGTGYNYCSQYITDEDALVEFKEHLGVDIPDDKFRLLKWPTGIRQKVWSHNVVSIGLSAGFIEPLESGGLYSVHEFLFKLIQVLPKSTTKWNAFQRAQFNHSVTSKFTSFRDFVVKHYTMGHRDDTPYWKDYTNMDSLIDLEDEEWLGEFPDLLTQEWENIQKINFMSEGEAYLLGGYEYDIMPEHYEMLSKENNYDIPDFEEPILRRTFMDQTLGRYPNAYEHYENHLYNGKGN